MKKRLYHILVIALMTGILLVSVLPLSVAAMGTVSRVQLVHIEQGNQFARQTAEMYGTLEEALHAAQSGDVIEIFSDVTVSAPLVIPDGMTLTIVSGTKREHTVIIGESAFEKTDRDAVTRTVVKSFDGSLFSLGKGSCLTLDNIILDGNGKSGTQGGLVYVGDGASLTVESRVTMKNAALGPDSRGGAVYVAENGQFDAAGVTFENNTASVGSDIYPESREDESAVPETQPGITEPEATEPDVTAPEATEPVVTETKAVEPHTAEPGESNPDTQTNPSQKKTGCGSSLCGAAACVLTAVCAAAVIKRKQRA